METQNPQDESKPEIVILPDRAALARDAATRFVALARESIQTRGRFAVALSGGSTPRELYARLATPEFASQVDWACTHFFWGDERAVPPDHPDSNFKMANDVLLSRVNVPAQNIHRIRAELPAEDAAREYEGELREFFNSPLSLRAAERQSNPQSTLEIATSPNASRLLAMTGTPWFDLILLGLGANGHTASLFPHTRVLRESQRWVAAEYINEVKMWRITLTAPVINAAANILWLVTGMDKAETVHAVLRGAYRPDDLPAQLIRPANSKCVWLLDAAAASRLQ